MVGERGDGDGVRAVGVDEAGHLDDGVGVERGEGARLRTLRISVVRSSRAMARIRASATFS